MNALAQPSIRLRLATLQWLAGFVGVAIVVLLVVPELVKGKTLPLPLWAICLTSLLQAAAFLAIAVWTGSTLAPRLSLRAPVFEALARSTSLMQAIQPLLLPGLIGGVIAGAFLHSLSLVTPAELAAASQTTAVPLAARLLYGGVTEELLLRWGLMTATIALLRRFIQRTQDTPSPAIVWSAIIVSALLFGVGHLPAANAMLGGLTTEVTLYVIGGNTVFGLMGGWLFWRHGLESAMLAHALAHLIAYCAA